MRRGWSIVWRCCCWWPAFAGLGAGSHRRTARTAAQHESRGPRGADGAARPRRSMIERDRSNARAAARSRQRARERPATRIGTSDCSATRCSPTRRSSPRIRCSSTSTSRRTNRRASKARARDCRRSRFPPSPRRSSTPTERVELQQLIDLVRSRNPYQLDASGALLLPGFAPDHAGRSRRGTGDASAVGGQCVPQARRQGHQAAGAQDWASAGLKPFGYDLFKDTSVDVRAGHRRAGAFRLHRRSGRSAQRAVVRQPEPHSAPDRRSRRPHQLSRSSVPSTSAARPSRASPRISKQRVARQMIGVRASVGMGDTRSIRVFVMGEANRPGSYTVSGLATITSALYAAGGVKPIGSLRDIQLKRARRGHPAPRPVRPAAARRHQRRRQAAVRATSSSFRRCPPRWRSMAKCIDRRSTRLKGTTSVADIVQLAGGLTPEADTSRAALVRVNDAACARGGQCAARRARRAAASCCAMAIRCASCVCGPRSTRA